MDDSLTTEDDFEYFIDTVRQKWKEHRNLNNQETTANDNADLKDVGLDTSKKKLQPVNSFNKKGKNRSGTVREGKNA